MASDRPLRRLLLCGAVLVAAGAALAASARSAPDATEFWVRAATLHSGSGAASEGAVVHVRDGRIVSVGEAPPSDAVVHEVRGGHLTPGWIDAATSLGVRGGAVEASEALTPGVRAIDAFKPDDPGLTGIAHGGVTTIGVLPAPGNLAAGSAGVVSLGADAPRVVVRGGPPVFAFRSPALGANRIPATLAGARLFLTAALRGEVWETPAEAVPPIRPSALERLKALSDTSALAYVDTPESARVAAEVLKTKGLRPVLVGVNGGPDDAPSFAELAAPCVITGLDLGDPVLRLSLPAALHRAGAPVALSSGAPGRAVHTLRTALALAVAYGLPTEAAVAAVTSTPARCLGVEESVGHVRAGAEADLVVFDGPPWELTSRVVLVVADGRVVVAPERKETP